MQDKVEPCGELEYSHQRWHATKVKPTLKKILKVTSSIMRILGFVLFDGIISLALSIKKYMKNDLLEYLIGNQK